MRSSQLVLSSFSRFPSYLIHAYTYIYDDHKRKPNFNIFSHPPIPPSYPMPFCNSVLTYILSHPQFSSLFLRETPTEIDSLRLSFSLSFWQPFSPTIRPCLPHQPHTHVHSKRFIPSHIFKFSKLTQNILDSQMSDNHSLRNLSHLSLSY